jgi:hypothetical protein
MQQPSTSQPPDDLFQFHVFNTFLFRLDGTRMSSREYICVGAAKVIWLPDTVYRFPKGSHRHYLKTNCRSTSTSLEIALHIID